MAGVRRVARAIVPGLTLALLAGSAGFAEGDEDARSSSKVRPDASIALAKSGGFVGKHVYNITGRRQTLTAEARPGGRVAFLVKVQNDGAIPDAIVVGGPKPFPGFRVRYFDGGRPVTRQVAAGTYRVGPLDPGESHTLRLVIEVRQGTSQATIGFALTLIGSERNAHLRDAVKANVVVSG